MMVVVSAVGDQTVPDKPVERGKMDEENEQKS